MCDSMDIPAPSGDMPITQVVIAFSLSPSPSRTQAPADHTVRVVSVPTGISWPVLSGSSCAVRGGPCFLQMRGPVANSMASSVVGLVDCRMTNSTISSVVGRAHRQLVNPQKGRQGTHAAQTGHAPQGVSSFSAQRSSARVLSHPTSGPQGPHGDPTAS